MRLFKIVLLVFSFLCVFALFGEETKGDNNDIFKWNISDNGNRELVYNWDKPAVIYSLSISKGENIVPGQEIMVLSVPGRSKANVKIARAMTVLGIGEKNGQMLLPRAESI